MTDAEFILLSCLNGRTMNGPELRDRLVANDCYSSKSNLAYKLRKMHARGWLRAREDGDDRRAWSYTITPAGKKAHGARRRELQAMLRVR